MQKWLVTTRDKYGRDSEYTIRTNMNLTEAVHYLNLRNEFNRKEKLIHAKNLIPYEERNVPKI
jgi:hypothetical protein